MSSGSRKKRKRKRRQQGAARAKRPSGQEAMERGYARSRAKSEEVRAALKPLARGERPTAVTVGAIVLFVVVVVNVGLFVAGVKIGSQRPNVFGVALYSGVLLLTGWGMWRARYWAVLGMQTLLAITLILACLALVLGTPDALATIALLAIIAAAGTLFWFLIKAMARIQMPERPGANR
jgi:hypothetical protein